MDKTLSLLPLGGIEDVTRNMYLYMYGDEILIVDCGLGFADETMLGVDLLLPDISYLLSTKKKIVGMLLTHGHEDHIGALPFLLPQLPDFPIYATPLTAAFANEKLKEFTIGKRVQEVRFDKPEVKIGSFSARFIHVTHSVLDTAHIFIKTPVGNFYHGSDFKFDVDPALGLGPDFSSIEKAGEEGVLCLLSDCLGAEHFGAAISEKPIQDEFEKAISKTRGKAIITTYSSNIARLQQAINAAQKYNRKICFVGRSLIKAKDIAKNLGYLKIAQNQEIPLDQLARYNDKDLVLLVAGSQGQENSAMSRIAALEHREIRLKVEDCVIFSSDPIPGNEVSVYSLIDAICKIGATVVYSDVNRAIHVSGHGPASDLTRLISLVKPKKLLPIGGNPRHMSAYRSLAQSAGYSSKDVLLLEDGQEVRFSKDTVLLGEKIVTKNVYVDQITGEEMENYVLRDRKLLSESGVIIVIVEIEAATSQLLGTPQIISRGFSGVDIKELEQKLGGEVRNLFKGKKGKVSNWVYVRKLIGEITERILYKKLRTSPMVLPIVIEV